MESLPVSRAFHGAVFVYDASVAVVRGPQICAFMVE